MEHLELPLRQTTLYGAGVPSPTLGNNGDLYVDTSTNLIYYKSAGTWTATGASVTDKFTFKGEWSPPSYASASGLIETLEEGFMPYTFTADNAGAAGNSISLTFNHGDLIQDIVDAWNTANPGNTVTVTEGNNGYYAIFNGVFNLTGGAANVTLADGVGDVGDTWVSVVKADPDFGSGPVHVNVGDLLYYDGTIWRRIVGKLLSDNTTSGEFLISNYGEIAAISLFSLAWDTQNSNLGVGTAAPSGKVHAVSSDVFPALKGQSDSSGPAIELAGIAGVPRIQILDDTGLGIVNILVPTLSASYDWTLPDAQGAANTSLVNNGFGNLSWESVVLSSEKGASLGVATLDAGGKIPVGQLPSSLMTFEGTWNANTNTPTLADGVGDAGMVYIVTVAGTQDLGSGPQTFAVGDWVVYNSSNIWQWSANSNAVVSVNGYVGVVTLDKTDIGLSNVDNTSDATKNAAAATLTNKTISAASNTITGVLLTFTPTSDNRLMRADGTAGDAVQGSAVTLSDSGEMSGLTRLDADNLRLDGNTLSSVSGDLVLTSFAGLVDLNATYLRLLNGAGLAFYDDDGSNNIVVKIPSTVSTNRTPLIPDQPGDFLLTTGTQAVSNKTVTSSTIDSTPIGSTTRAAGSFTTVDANSTISGVSVQADGTGGNGFFESAEQSSAPATPASSFSRLYPKSDGWYYKNSAGTERQVGVRNKWQRKTLGSSFTSTGEITGLKFSNLVVGKTYRYSGTLGLSLNNAARDALQMEIRQGSTNIDSVEPIKEKSSPSNELENTSYSFNVIFTATETTANLNVTSNSGSTAIDTTSWAMIEELNDYDVTTDFT